MTEERKAAVTFKGAPQTVLGPDIKAGDTAPAFTVHKGWNVPVNSADYAGKLTFINAVPSLDTGICDAQTKRFNEEAAKFPDVEFLTISCDLPQAQARWCGAAGVDKMKTASDYRDRSFGTGYGVYVKELGILQRSIFILGKDNKVKYVQRVPEIVQHPDYDAALAALKSAV